jgi:hypothetical protein
MTLTTSIHTSWETGGEVEWRGEDRYDEGVLTKDEMMS